MKEAKEGNFLMNMDCLTVWELLISETLKGSQLAGDGGSIISIIIGSESK